MTIRALSAVIALALAIAPASAQDKPLPAGAEKAQAAVKAHLDKLKGGHAQLVYEDAAVLQKVFPEHTFIVARYRQFPVARQLPEGLSAANVFAVTNKEHTVKLIKGAKELEAFFQASQMPADNEAGVKRALTAWLTLAQEFHQDGFYKFQVLDKDFEYKKDDKVQTVRGKALVTQGGKGELAATLAYDDGKLVKATEGGKIQQGIRPICQATKLLDRDPIVRKMAEADLLFMGLAAEDYLMEQRRQANPELRAAIDRLWRRIRAAGW